MEKKGNIGKVGYRGVKNRQRKGKRDDENIRNTDGGSEERDCDAGDEGGGKEGISQRGGDPGAGGEGAGGDLREPSAHLYRSQRRGLYAAHQDQCESGRFQGL